MSEDFKRVKEALNLLSVITSESGLVMKKKHLEECPFCRGHECFSIFKRDGQEAYKCHQCDASGDVFTFLESYSHLDKSQALRRAAELASITLSSTSTTKVIQETIKERIFKAASEYYNQCALAGPGYEYFIERRGHAEHLIADMRLGYTAGAELKDHLLRQHFSIEDILSAGLISEMKTNGDSSEKVYRDFFPKACAIFPHFDNKGRIIHFTQKDADLERAASDKKVKWQLRKEHRDKTWLFYNQKVVSADSVILVEGENDLLALMSAGHKNVMAIIGQISDVQLKCLKDNLKHKTLYIWLDVDGKVDKGDPSKNTQKLGTGGRGFTEKICNALRGAAYDVRIIEHPGEAKDPDEYLQGYEGKRRQEVQRLVEHSINYVSWQLKRIGESKDISDIIIALKDRKMFSTIAAMPRIDRLPYIEALKSMGLDEETIKEQLEVNRELRDAIGVITAKDGLAKACPYKLTNVIYEHFEATGKFFRDREHKVYLLYNNIIYEIDNNRPFNALMDKSGGLLVNRAPGPQIWEALACRGYNHGVNINIASWLVTKETRRIIYVNFNASDNTILKISADDIKEVPNGLNEDDVLLKASDKISPMEFNSGVMIKDGLEILRDLVLDNMTCDREQRYLIICWAISAFLLDFMPYQAIMKFSGSTASGKTTAAKLLSKLLYGQEELGHVSSAAAYSLAAQNPMVILDNLEENDRNKSLKMFLLLCATGGSKEKRAGGTDSDTVQEKPKSLILITAIEPLEEPELINRTIDIEFSKAHRTEDFVESTVLREIGKHRQDIISAILKLLQKDILPDLETGIKRNLHILKGSHKGHSKDRSDEYLALLMLILEKLLPHIPLKGEDDFTNNPAEIWAEWLRYQDRQAEDDEIEGNNILRMLDGLAYEYEVNMRNQEYKSAPTMPGFKHLEITVFKYRHPQYMLEAEKTEPEHITKDKEGKPCEPYYKSMLIFTASSNQIVSAMSSWCKDKGSRVPFESAARFTKRLTNDEPTLKRGGWHILKDPKFNGKPYSKVVQGTRYLTLVKTMER